MMNDEIYKDLFYASKNFQNFAKRVRRFPQPLYMISLFEIFFDKVNSYLPKKTKNYKAHYTPILSDQVERNLRDLTSIHIHETSDKKKETYMIFTLQPLITINKNFKTENEINLLKQIKIIILMKSQMIFLIQLKILNFIDIKMKLEFRML